MDSKKIFYIEWVDANCGIGWEKFDDAADVHLCQSIGFLVKETKKSIILAAAVSNNEANATVAIPKSWIRKKRRIKL